MVDTKKFVRTDLAGNFQIRRNVIILFTSYLFNLIIKSSPQRRRLFETLVFRSPSGRDDWRGYESRAGRSGSNRPPKSYTLDEDAMQIVIQFLKPNARNPTALYTYCAYLCAFLGLFSLLCALFDVLAARVCAWAILKAWSLIFKSPNHAIGILTQAAFFFSRPYLRNLYWTVRRFISRDGADDDHAWDFATGSVSTLAYVVAFWTFANFSFLFALLRMWLPWLSTMAGFLVAAWAIPVYCFKMPVLAPLRASFGAVHYMKPLCLHLREEIDIILIVLFTRLELGYRAYYLYKEKLWGNKRPSCWGQPFVYSPLIDSRSIRLLRISRNNPLSDFDCAIVHTTLEQAPVFEAVSYHWGEPVFDKELIIDGRAFNVTSEVFDIVQSRASPFYERLLWIDSVCINQQDPAEKGLQILLMRDIYSYAQTVVVWLDNSPTARHANDYMCHVMEQLHLSRDQNAPKSLIGPMSTDSRGPALFKLLDHPWWSRAWVVQEIAVAKKIIVFQGGEYFNWDFFEGFLRNASKLSPRSFTLFSSMGSDAPLRMPASVDQMPLLTNIKNQYQNSDSNLTLGQLLSLARRCQASDPRDKVYAFLGLTTAARNPVLAPDYTKSVVEVFTNTARYLCAQDLLATLAESGLGHARNTDGLPSWAPDFSSPQRNIQLHLAESSPELKAASYRASRDTHPSYALHPILPIMRISGILLEPITKLGPDCEPWGREHGTDKVLIQTIAKFLSLFDFVSDNIGPGIYPYTGEAYSELLWRFRIGDRSGVSASIQRPAPPVYGEYFSMVLETMTKIRDQIAILEASNQLLKALELPLQFDHELGSLIRLSEAVGTAGQCQRLAVTQNGALCMVPLDTRVGDRVGVIKGAQACSLFRSSIFPGVVRDAGNITGTTYAEIEQGPGKWFRPNFQFVGNAYVHGYMDGEMVNDSRPWEDIYIW